MERVWTLPVRPLEALDAWLADRLPVGGSTGPHRGACGAMGIEPTTNSRNPNSQGSSNSQG